MHHDHVRLDHHSTSTLDLCTIAPYLLGFDPTGLLVALPTDDRTSAWPGDPATTSPGELARQVTGAATATWWPHSYIVLFAYRPVRDGLLAEAVAAFVEADCSVQAAWTVDVGNGLIYPCIHCDADPVPFNRSPTIAAVMSAEDTARSGVRRRELRDRLNSVAAGSQAVPGDDIPADATVLLRHALLGADDPSSLEAEILNTVLRLPGAYTRAESMTLLGQVPAGRLLHLVRHTPTGCRANTASLLATAAAQYPAPDPLLAIDALAIALDDASDPGELERCNRLINSLYLPPITSSSPQQPTP